MEQWREKTIILGVLVIFAIAVMVHDTHESQRGNLVLPSPVPSAQEISPPLPSPSPDMVVPSPSPSPSVVDSPTPSPSPSESPLVFSVRGQRGEDD